MPLLLIAYAAFIGLGLPDPLPGALWPVSRHSYGMPTEALGLVLAAIAGGYVLASLVAGRAMEAFGTGGVLAGSVALTAIAALGQAMAPPWPLLLLCAGLAGLGGGAVDTGLNMFAARHFAPRHLNWLHACWGLGATLGPTIAAFLLAEGASWQAGYAVVGSILAALTMILSLTRRRWDDGPSEASDGPRVPALTVLRQPVARRQIGIFFLYCGVEAGAGQWCATVLNEAQGASPAFAGLAATLYWGSIGLGRVGMGLIVERIGADRLIHAGAWASAGAAAIFALGAAGGPSTLWLSLLGLALLAVALSPLFPTLMSRTPARIGPGAVHVIGAQSAAATVSIAIVPGALGLAAGHVGPAIVPALLLALALLLAWQIRRLTVTAKGA
ncbi:MFS transporter [Acetobacteraceae bacterium H6797]|nr:MFS transporter [Acetobacteraceae bacterium H6797]